MLFLDNAALDSMCTTLEPVIKLVKNILIPVMQMGIPIILIVLGMFDLGKAVIASKEDEIKSAQKLLIKRAIYAVAIFFITFVVKAVFDAIGSVGTNGALWWNCWKNF